MASSITIRRCQTLPETLESNTIYFVKGESDTDVILYITGNDPIPVRHTISRTEILELIEDNGTGIIKVDELPLASEAIAGRLYCLNGTNNPCWCNGTDWFDLSKASGTTGDGDTVDVSANKLYRNESVFGIKIL